MFWELKKAINGEEQVEDIGVGKKKRYRSRKSSELRRMGSRALVEIVPSKGKRTTLSRCTAVKRGEIKGDRWDAYGYLYTYR